MPGGLRDSVEEGRGQQADRTGLVPPPSAGRPTPLPCAEGGVSFPSCRPGQLAAGERMFKTPLGPGSQGGTACRQGEVSPVTPRPPEPLECARWRLRAAPPPPAPLADRPQRVPPRSGAADACQLASAGSHPAWPAGSTSKCHSGRGQACQRGDERSPRRHVPGLPAVTAVWRRQPSKETQGRTATLPRHLGLPGTSRHTHTPQAPGRPRRTEGLKTQATEDMSGVVCVCACACVMCVHTCANCMCVCCVCAPECVLCVHTCVSICVCCMYACVYV